MSNGKLYEDALKLAVNKNLTDIITVIGWAQSAPSLAEKRKHIKHARELMQDIEQNLDQIEA